MATISKILAPVDFSERSAAEIDCAQAVAAHFRSKLVLLHVVTPSQMEIGAMESGLSVVTGLYRARVEQAGYDLDAISLPDLTPESVRRVVATGEPADAIVEWAHKEAVDLIIMPTRGYGAFRRFILGSNTAKILHDADCPVWTGIHVEQAPARELSPFGHILCAVDLGGQSSKALWWAAMVARETGAHLTLMHAMPACPEATAEAAQFSEPFGAAQRELERLDSFVHAGAEIVIEPGEPVDAIRAVAERLHATLLVIGRGSAAGVYGRLRTNAYAIIRQSPIPVVSI